MKYMITGANGFIGTAMTNYLVKNGHTVLAIDKEFDTSRFVVSSDLKFYKTDLADFQMYMANPNDEYDIMYHFAWVGTGAGARDNLSPQMINVDITSSCVSLAKKWGCKNFVYAGSLMEYELADTIHNNQSSKINYYAFAKLLAHAEAKKVAEECGITFITGIISNTFGPGESIKSNRFINRTINACLDERTTTLSNGSNWYDFVYIDDAVRAFEIIGLWGQHNVEYGIMGNLKPSKMYDYGCLLQLALSQGIENAKYYKMINYDLSLSPVCQLPEELYCELAERTAMLGYRPSVDFTEGVKRTLNYIKGERSKNG